MRLVGSYRSVKARSSNFGSTNAPDACLFAPCGARSVHDVEMSAEELQTIQYFERL
jgi:hypothetical protein